MAEEEPIHVGRILTGLPFKEPMRVETAQTTGPGTSVVGPLGVHSERFRSMILTSGDLKSLGNALSALCRKDSEEKRLFDTRLPAVPR